MTFGQLRAPIPFEISNPYAGSSSRILTDPTGERRNRQFRERFRGLRSCRPNPSGESGIKDYLNIMPLLGTPKDTYAIIGLASVLPNRSDLALTVWRRRKTDSL